MLDSSSAGSSAETSPRSRSVVPSTNSTTAYGALIVSSSCTKSRGVATGTSVVERARVTVISRATSWADGVPPAVGGRRSTHLETPSVSR